MTLDGLARFALSRSGKVYAATCERFGVDPASILDEDDDVIALSFRTALMHSLMSDQPEAPEVDDRPGIVTDLDKVIARMERR